MNALRFSEERLKMAGKARRTGFVDEVKKRSSREGDVWVIPGDVWHAATLAYLKPPINGAGDLVAKVAQPIANAIDSMLGTSLSGCGGCAARQEALNKAFPLK